MSRCRSCHAPVSWVQTTAGKRTPVDAVDQGGWVAPLVNVEDARLRSTGERVSDGRGGTVVVVEALGDLELAAPPADGERRYRVTVAVGGGTFERDGSGYQRAWPALDAPMRTRTSTAGDGFACPPWLVNSNHDDDRVAPADGTPMPTATSRIGTGLVTPYISAQRANSRPSPADAMPLATVTAGGNHLELTIPAIYVKNFGGNARPEDLCRPADRTPLGTITSRDHHALVIPYRRGRARTTAEPLHTLATKESAALCSIEIDINDCHYRMLKPREHLRGQRFRDAYVVKGNLGEQTAQAGNAVPVNVAHWIGRELAGVLS